MKTTALLLCTLIGFMFFTGCAHVPEHRAARMETEWMAPDAFNSFLTHLDEKENGANFWDKGHWVDSVDGRWKNGVPQYKIRYSSVPSNDGYWWYWWYNQDQTSFRKHMHELANEGFTLVHYQSFTRPSGDVRYQGVWHKLIPESVKAITEPSEDSPAE